MKIVKTSICIVVLYLSCLNLSAQEEIEYNWFIGGRYNYGFIHPHRNSIRYSIEDHIHAIELFAGKQYTGAKLMGKLYRYPDVGLAYYYSPLSNNAVFGNVHAIFPYFSASVYTAKRYKSAYSIGAGLAYVTRVWDLYDNNLNIAIGSHFNIFLKFAIKNEFAISDKLVLTNEIFVNHFSNGRIQSPNKGLNQVMANIGVKYYLDEREYYKINDIPEFSSRNEYALFATFATKTIDRFNTGRHEVINISFEYARKVTYKRKFTVGLDLLYDNSIAKSILMDSGKDSDISQLTRLGIHGGQEVMINNLGASMQLGVYIHNKWKPNTHLLYQCYGFRYYVSDRIFGVLVLRAHYGVADHLGWGIGYIF